MQDQSIPEEWRPVPYQPFDSAYEVSSLGRVRRTLPHTNMRWQEPNRIMAPQTRGGGYQFVRMTISNAGKTATVHKMVALAFLGPPPFPNAVVRHLDDVPAHNVVTNLRWGSQKENIADTLVTGHAAIRRVGERHFRARLTTEIVRTIRDRAAMGEVTYRIAADLGLSYGSVWAVVHRRTWMHLD